MIKIYENFLPKQFEDEILNLHTSEELPWFFLKNTVNFDTSSIVNKNAKNNFQLYHTFFLKEPYSKFYDYMIKILNFIEIKYKNIHRVKSNLNTNLAHYMKDNFQIPHTDSDNDNFYSLLYYVNDSDGDTLFFEGDTITNRVVPKKGKAVLFKSNILHCASNPIKYDYRIVTNFVFEV
jgi:hypothetical protein